VDKNDTVPKPKKPIQVLRERRGGVPDELRERSRLQVRVLKQICEALEDGPRTIPDIADATGLPSHEVLWYVMGMKKYGRIAEGDERDEYYEYALQEEEEKET